MLIVSHKFRSPGYDPFVDGVGYTPVNLDNDRLLHLCACDDAHFFLVVARLFSSCIFLSHRPRVPLSFREGSFAREPGPCEPHATFSALRFVPWPIEIAGGTSALADRCFAAPVRLPTYLAFCSIV